MKVQQLTLIKASIILLSVLSSCVNHLPNEEDTEPRHLTFQLGYDLSQSPMTRAALSDYITSISLFDIVDGKTVNTIVQQSTEDDFGTIEAILAHGEHELVFVGHNSDACTRDESTGAISLSEWVKDTFSYTLKMTVDNDTKDGTQTVSLARRVAMLKLVVLDAIPDKAASMQLKIEGYGATLSPETGLAASTTTLTRKWNYQQENMGKSGTTYSIYTFLPAEKDVKLKLTVNVLDANGASIASREISSVPVAVNTVTTVSGKLFSTAQGANLVISSDWSDGEFTVEF